MSIHLVMDFILDELGDYLASKNIGTRDNPFVEFVTINQDATVFPDQKAGILLLNVEEEQMLQPPDRFQLRANGVDHSVSPPLRLNLLIMIAIKQNGYDEAMKMLSGILSFFQANPVFYSSTFPRLPDNFDKLVVELFPQSLAQQNEIWSMLKTAYLPSVVYKVKMIVIQEDPLTAQAPIKNIQNNL